VHVRPIHVSERLAAAAEVASGQEQRLTVRDAAHKTAPTVAECATQADLGQI
jgi:hypothetical protein